MEILLLILANNFLSALKKSTSFASKVAPQLHFSPAWEGDSTAKHSGQTATLTKIWPASGLYSDVPLSILIKTDFPLPLRPKIPNVSPSVIFKLISLRTSTPSKVLVIFFSVIKSIKSPY